MVKSPVEYFDFSAAGRISRVRWIEEERVDRGYIKLYPEAEHVSWIRLGVEQYRTSRVVGIRLDYLEIV